MLLPLSSRPARQTGSQGPELAEPCARLPSKLVAGLGPSALSPTTFALILRAEVQVAFEIYFSSPARASRGGTGKKEEPGASEGWVEEEEQEGVKTKLVPAVGVSVPGSG